MVSIDHGLVAQNTISKTMTAAKVSTVYFSLNFQPYFMYILLKAATGEGIAKGHMSRPALRGVKIPMTQTLVMVLILHYIICNIMTINIGDLFMKSS